MKRLWKHLLKDNHEMWEGFRYVAKHGLSLKDETKQKIKHFSPQDFIIKHWDVLFFILAAFLIGMSVGGYPVQNKCNDLLEDMHQQYLEDCKGIKLDTRYLNITTIIPQQNQPPSYESQTNTPYINQTKSRKLST